MQNKIWFIQIAGEKQGPYSASELKTHPSFTPDTLVYKEGFKAWIAARYVKELSIVFEDEVKPSDVNEPDWKSLPADEAVMARVDEGSFSPLFFYWLILLTLVLLYVYYRIYFSE